MIIMLLYNYWDIALILLGLFFMGMIGEPQ